MLEQPLIVYWLLSVKSEVTALDTLPLSVQHLHDLIDTMPLHWLPGMSHPILI